MLPFVPPLFPLYAVYAVMLHYFATAGVKDAHRNEMWTRCAASSFVNVWELLQQEITALTHVVGPTAIATNLRAISDQLDNIDRTLEGIDRADIIILDFMNALPAEALEEFRSLEEQFDRFRALVRIMDRAGFRIMRAMTED